MKTQTEAQLKGRWGELVAAFAFPAHWIVRPLPHDFGIDLQVEVFKELPPDSKERQRYRATGGHFSCQVKTQESVRTKSDTVVFSASTTDLLLAETMGASAPLVLLLVDRETRDLYYLCLTDYIPYVLDGAGSAWRSQGSVTLEIPTKKVVPLNVV
ncbi:DUF4365 domain-containing protein [Microbacterium sp. No. 7]|uniref:DUF4365 domain-containing protein n=1 Tax=Microbacterium sp. No. 7 TaxID=1714373 RepID=UPI0006D15F2D|nr:DUF4365 domain-containing protein [Microbacterium sp. No. 7]ALJ18421.1 hypothetical protein AOA12_00190 [Microbacterium sp. No. 7]